MPSDIKYRNEQQIRNVYADKMRNGEEESMLKVSETSFSPIIKDDFRVLPQDEKDADQEYSCREGWKSTLLEFTQTTTLHGFRYIWMADAFRFRRLFWLILLLVGTGIMCFQIIDRILFYYDSPVNVNVEVNFNRSLAFPAVTICNQNSFRATAAAKENRYRLIEHLYSSDPSSVDLTQYSAGGISLEDLFVSAAHQKEDLIVECIWDGQPCSSDNFTMVLTDHGVCYTFGDNHSSLQVSSAGSENGLHLTLNIEQYEYMPGPHGAAGVKIFMHDEADTPLVGELGFAIPAGSHSFVGNSLLVMKNLPPPHGECGKSQLKFFDFYSQANCKLDCLTKLLESKCGCRDFYMPSKNGVPPVCTLQQQYACMVPALKNYEKDGTMSCGHCYVSCYYSVYEPILSYATISNFVIDKLLTRVNSDKLGQRFMAAKEITHRMEDNKFNKFKRLVEKVEKKFNSVKRLITVEITKRLDFLSTNMKQQKVHLDEVWNRKYTIYRYQDFMLKKNFLRGRDAMEERTLGQIGNGFEVFVLDFEKKLKDIADTSGTNSSSREILRTLLLDRLGVEEEMVKRGISNLTTLIESYQNGTPIFHYKFDEKIRKENNYVVPKALLKYALVRTWHARNNGMKINDGLELLLDYISVYRRLVIQAYEKGIFDEEEVRQASNKYRGYTRKYYHNRANLYFESIDWAGQETERRKEEFLKLKSAADAIFEDMESNINSLNDSLRSVKGTILHNLGYGCDMAKFYLTDDTISKLNVSHALTAPDIHEGINTMKVFLQEVRSRGQNLFDDWTKLIDSFGEIWTNILDDENSVEYYQYTNMMDFLQNKITVLDKLNSDITTIRDSGDLRDVIKNRGRIFLKSLYDVMDEAEDFKKATTLDGSFLRDNFVFLNIYYSELRYEQITQQEGYGLFPLLCDIGGSMGLFIGASALTIFEVVDLFINQAATDYLRPRRKKSYTNSPPKV